MPDPCIVGAAIFLIFSERMPIEVKKVSKNARKFLS